MKWMRSAVAALILSMGVTVLLCYDLSLRFHNPFPSLAFSLSNPLTELNDFTGIALGMRRLAADIAWIQTLQYYATPEANQTEQEFENGIGVYPQFLAHCEKVARIDPYFTYVFYYGAAALGWNLNRLDEAAHLLQEGIQANPREWRLQQYMAALAYQKNHDISKLTQFLESFLYDPDCPNLLRSLLGNLYKKQGRYHDAVRVWLLVYKTNDPRYKDRAEEQIRTMLPLLHLPAKPAA